MGIGYWPYDSYCAAVNGMIGYQIRTDFCCFKLSIDDISKAADSNIPFVDLTWTHSF